MLLAGLLMGLQIGKAQQTFIGVRAGGNTGSAFINHTIFNLNINTGFQSGVQGGLLFKYLQKERNAFLNGGLQFSVNYVQKGWKQVFLTNEPFYTAEMNYVEVPVEAIGYFGNKNKYFITAGFYFEYLLDSDLAANPDMANLGGQDFYTYVPSRDNEVGYGARMSGGIFRTFPFGMVHIEGFFSYSISNFIDAGDITDETPDISNLWNTGVSVAYLFSLSKKQ